MGVERFRTESRRGCLQRTQVNSFEGKLLNKVRTGAGKSNGSLERVLSLGVEGPLKSKGDPRRENKSEDLGEREVNQIKKAV